LTPTLASDLSPHFVAKNFDGKNQFFKKSLKIERNEVFDWSQFFTVKFNTTWDTLYKTFYRLYYTHREREREKERERERERANMHCQGMACTRSF